MEAVGAIVFLARDTANEKPLLLEELLFAPAAVWLTAALEEAGIHRFFVVCHDEDRDGALACFPGGTEFVTTGTGDALERLSAFLEECPRVAAITQPVFLLPESVRQLAAGQPVSFGRASGCYELGQAVREALTGGQDFHRALRELAEEYRGDALLPLTRESWLSVTAAARWRSVERLAAGGVRFIDPDTVYIAPTAAVGPGTLILPGTILRGATAVGQNCELGPNTMITDCIIGDNVTVNASQLIESTVDDGAKIGPFAYIRPNCRVGRQVKVGGFVELKNSTVGEGTKISHLTYVGDTDAGARVDFGCGTVTVNYDGTAKFRTVVGDGAFIGCNTNLVAPVRIGQGAYTAAGSTITDDVPDDSLAIARAPQTVKVQWASKRRRGRGRK